MNIFDTVKFGFEALRAGKSLRNVESWKNVQIIGSLLAALLGLSASFGWNFGLTDQQIYGAAAFIAAMVNGYLTIATTKKVGLGNVTPQGSNDQSNLPAIELQSTKSVLPPGVSTTGYRESDAPISTFNGIPESVIAEETVDCVQVESDPSATIRQRTDGSVGTSESGWNG